MHPGTHPWDVPLHPSAGAAQVAFLSQSPPAREFNDFVIKPSNIESLVLLLSGALLSAPLHGPCR